MSEKLKSASRLQLDLMNSRRRLGARIGRAAACQFLKMAPKLMSRLFTSLLLGAQAEIPAHVELPLEPIAPVPPPVALLGNYLKLIPSSFHIAPLQRCSGCYRAAFLMSAAYGWDVI